MTRNPKNPLNKGTHQANTAKLPAWAKEGAQNGRLGSLYKLSLVRRCSGPFLEGNNHAFNGQPEVQPQKPKQILKHTKTNHKASQTHHNITLKPPQNIQTNPQHVKQQKPRPNNKNTIKKLSSKHHKTKENSNAPPLHRSSFSSLKTITLPQSNG